MGEMGRYNLPCSCSWIGLLLLLCSSISTDGVDVPIFTILPAQLVEFSNSSGATLQCKTDQPDTQIQWFLKDRNLVTDVKDLRSIDNDGNLIFPPFSAQSFRQDVHAAVYKCHATNALGTVVSHDIQVKAVVLQPYDVYVYDVYAMAGNTAVMRCHIPSFLSSYVNVTAWVRDSVVVIKATEMDHNSKYTLMPSGELFIKDVDMKDAMTSFQCQTYNRLNEEIVKSSTSGKLFVTEPQGNVPPKVILSIKRITAQRGQQIFMPCEVQANPPAKASWQKVGMPESSKNGLNKRQMQISGSMIIKNVMQSDSGIYRCISSNSVGQEYVDVDVTIIDPLYVEANIPSVVVDVGKTTSLSCKSSEIQGINWFKNGNALTPNKHVVMNNNNATIQISALSSNDKGIYQCCVANEFETACDSVAVILGDEPPVITEKFETVLKNPTENVKLKCVAKGNPQPTISWFLDDNLLKSEDKINIDMKSQVNGDIISELTINNLRTDNGGLYKCVAENHAGKDYHWARINVKGNVGVRSYPPLTVVNGETAILNCPMFGYPIEDVKWEKDNTLLPDELRQVQPRNDSLIIHNVNRARDTGIYLCTVRGLQGSHQGKIHLTVMIAPKLSPFSFQDELVQEGSRGRLQCVIIEGDSPLTLNWLKDGKPIPSNLGIAVRDFDEFSSILTISAITPRHNGKYTCTASNAAGTASLSTQLAVNVAPKITPFSFPETGLTEGVLARVSCVVYQGDLPIKITWLKNGKDISSVESIITKSFDDYSSVLTIENVRREHAGNYTCIARNSASSVSQTSELLVNVPPKIVPFTFQDDHIIEGSLLRVSCIVSRGDLPLTITWLKDERKLPDSVLVNKYDSYSTVLSIDPILREHTGNYTCKAQNQAGIAMYSAQLIVLVPAKWIFEPQSQTVKKGDNAYFHCKSDGYPKPTTTWTFAKDVKASARHSIYTNSDTIIFKNGTLVLKDVSKDREGRYICSASNGVGLGLSKTALLSILAPPFFEFESEILNGKLGGKIALNCTPNGDTPITITWHHNNQIMKDLPESRFKIFKDNSSSTLSILELTRKDSTTFTCEAKNTFGSSTMNFLVNVQEPPESPEIDLNPVSGNRSVYLSWKKPFDGNSQITHYLVQYKKQVDNWQLRKYNETVDYSKTATKIINLQPAVTYTFRVAAVNAIGVSKFSSEITQSTDADAPTGEVQKVEVEAIDGNTLRITWKPPRKDTWNGAIRGYNIGYREDGSNDAYEFSALEVPEDYTEDLIYQLSNLRKYTTYTVVIQAYNDKGVGPLIEPILVMTSEDVPSIAPEGLRCSTLSSKSIYVLWEPISSESANGILRGYKVFYKTVTEWYDPQVQFKISDKEKFTLQNLDVNTNYSIMVLAFTKIGDGVKSEPVYCKTHEDVPDRPRQIKALPSSPDSVLVAWKPPKRINGELIKYNIYYRPLSATEELNGDTVLKTEQMKDNNVHIFQSDMEYFEVKGLRKNHKYAFWVSATSPIGEGQYSEVIAQTVADFTVAATSASFDDVIQTPWKKDITLACRAVGVPTPQKKWSIGRDLVLIGGRKILLSDGTLLINKVESADSGNYTCSIYNNHGKDEVQYSLIVQVPPSAPILDIISKTRSTIQLQWKPGPTGGDTIKGYTLHYRKDGSDWENVELSADKEVFTLDNLACGANYQIYMEAYNKIGRGLPCDTIKTSTEGSEVTIPTTNQLLHEGSTFVSVHLETWPMTTCPVKSFQVEYKPLYEDEWTTVSSSIRTTQRKLVIPGLVPATWYALRITANTNGDAIPAEYKFATRTTTGATIPPPEIKVEKPQAPVYIFYLDPYIFIPAVALLIVVIIAAVVICIWIKRKSGSVGTPSDYGTWQGSGAGSSNYTASTMYATIPHHKRKRNDPNPYATGHVGDCFLDSDAWVETRTLTRGNPRDHQDIRFLPQRMSESMQQNMRLVPNIQETTFAFGPGSHNAPNQMNCDYDKPPKGM